jgi:hypothetical protein
MQIMIDQKQVQTVEYFNYLGRMITNDARCHGKSCFQQGEFFFCQQIGLKFKEETSKLLHLMVLRLGHFRK